MLSCFLFQNGIKTLFILMNLVHFILLSVDNQNFHLAEPLIETYNPVLLFRRIQDEEGEKEN